jgi:hypothetical protein
MEDGTEMKTIKKLKEGEKQVENWVYRVDEVIVEDDEVGEHQLYDDTYPAEFLDDALSQEEWSEVMEKVNEIWRPAGTAPLHINVTAVATRTDKPLLNVLQRTACEGSTCG